MPQSILNFLLSCLTSQFVGWILSAIECYFCITLFAFSFSFFLLKILVELRKFSFVIELLYFVVPCLIKVGEKHILVPTFLGDSHFSSYPEKCFPFWSLPLHQKRKKLTWQTVGINNIKLMYTWFKLIIKKNFGIKKCHVSI